MGLKPNWRLTGWHGVVDAEQEQAKMRLSMNVALTERHKHFVAEKVKSGAYGSATEVVREGLRLLEANDERQRRIEWLQQEVEKSLKGWPRLGLATMPTGCGR
jgi:putative addiction module CopG family antidote